jgi:hypothetical protein
MSLLEHKDVGEVSPRPRRGRILIIGFSFGGALLLLALATRMKTVLATLLVVGVAVSIVAATILLTWRREGDAEGFSGSQLVIRIIRIVFIAAQSICLLAGLALIIAGSIWMFSLSSSFKKDYFIGLTLALFVIGAGVILALISSIGLAGAITHNMSCAIAYSLLLVFLIGVQAYVLWSFRILDSDLKSITLVGLIFFLQTLFIVMSLVISSYIED